MAESICPLKIVRKLRLCSKLVYEIYDIADHDLAIRHLQFKMAEAIWTLIIIQWFARSLITCSCSWSFIGCRYYRLRYATMHAYSEYIYLCFFRLGKVPVLTSISDRLLNSALSACSSPAYHRSYRELNFRGFRGR